jgi:hypothetical protein
VNSSNSEVLIVTLVKDDFESFLSTRDSIVSHSSGTPHWIFDSSKDSRVKDFCVDQSLIFYNRIEAVGIYRSMNKAIKKISETITSDPFILFLHSGDTLVCKESLSALTKEIPKSSSWFYTDYEVFDPRSNLIKVIRPIDWTMKRQLFVIKPIHHQALFIKLSLLQKFDGFDTDYEIGADWDLLCRVSLSERGTYLPRKATRFALGGYSSAHRRIGNRELLMLRDRHLSKTLSSKLLSRFFYIYRSFRIVLLENILSRSHFLLVLTRLIARWK